MGGERLDVVMVATIDPTTGDAAVVSIPRDMAGIPLAGGDPKGPSVLLQTGPSYGLGIATDPSARFVIVATEEGLWSVPTAGGPARAIDFGASGFVPKSQPVEQIRTAVQAVLAGDIWTPPEIDISDVNNSADEELIARLAKLTPQQVRVLMMLAEGLLNKQIAYELGVSEATIKAHVSAILQKLGVDSRTQAVIAMNRVGTQELQGVVER